MKILFVVPDCPYPPDKGTALRNFHLIKGLAARHEIHLLGFSHGEKEPVWPAELRRYCQRIEFVPAPTRTTWRRLMTILFSPLPDMAWRLPSLAMEEKLRLLLALENYDLVQIEGIELGRYLLLIKGHLPGDQGLTVSSGDRSHVASGRYRVVFDDHNAEYLLQKRAFEIDRHYPRKWIRAFYSLVQWQKLRRYEQLVCRHADQVVAVSEADRVALQSLSPGLEVAVVPNGVDCEKFSPALASQTLPPLPTDTRRLASLVFTGTMDFRPNIDAVTWFCSEVLPLIQRELFHVHVCIVGKSPAAEVRALADNPAVTVTGYVEDIRPYVLGSKIYIVPLRMGSGTKLKVLQAMAMGIPVVSTSLGIEGIRVTPGEEILVGDTPEEFARQVIALLNDEGKRTAMARRAREVVVQQYDWQQLIPRLEAVYAQMFARPERAYQIPNAIVA